MKLAPPFISIIIPVYNSQNIIDACIQCFLIQDYPKDKYEVIVVDNNSTDNTAQVIKQFPVTYILETKQSSYAARNAGARLAKGEALLFFDADQLVDKDFLATFCKYWNETEYGAFGAHYVAIGERNTLAAKYWHNQETLKFENKKTIKHSFAKLGGGNTLVRREVFDALKGFDDNLISWGDYDFSFRLQQAGYKVRYVDEAIIGHMERNTVKSLLRREYRIGFGRSSFDKKHPSQRERLVLIFENASYRTIKGFFALLLGLVKPIKPGLTRREHLGFILLDIAMRWYYFWGRMHYILKIAKQKIPAKW